MSDAADAPLDEVDAAVLAELAAAYTAADPPPPGLDEQVSFAMALHQGDLEVEVARLSEDLLVGSGARAAEQPRTLTFDCAALTIMVTVVALPGERRRIDGWLAPPAPLAVQARAGGSGTVTHEVTADVSGRFVIADVPAGLAQFTVRLPEVDRTVVTPAVVL
jgi:hypothetical protein